MTTNRLLLSLFFFILFYINLDAQWEYHLDNPNIQYQGFDLEELSNGHFAACGIKKTATDDFVGMVVVVDANGAEVYTRSFEDYNIRTCYSVVAVSDGFIVVGASPDFEANENQIIVVKLNNNGVVLWGDSYGLINVIGNSNIDAVVLEDERIAIASSTQGGTTNIFNTILHIISAQGNLESASIVETETFDFSRAIALAPDGNLLITGEINGNLFVQKIDLAGNILWTSNLYVNELIISIGYDLVVNPVGEIVVLVRQNNITNGAPPQTIVLKLDSDGMLIWETSLDFSDQAIGSAICLAPDGGYAITGNIDTEITSDLFLAKIKDDSTFDWVNIFDQAENGYGLIATQDGGYAMTGYGYQQGAADIFSDLYIAKTNGNGVLTNTKIPSLAIQSLNISPNPAASFINVVLTLEDAVQLEAHIVDINGRYIQKLPLEGFFLKGKYQFNFDVSSLQDAYYQLIIESEKKQISKPFIKMKK